VCSFPAETSRVGIVTRAVIPQTPSRGDSSFPRLIPFLDAEVSCEGFSFSPVIGPCLGHFFSPVGRAKATHQRPQDDSHGTSFAPISPLFTQAPKFDLFGQLSFQVARRTINPQEAILVRSNGEVLRYTLRLNLAAFSHFSDPWVLPPGT